MMGSFNASPVPAAVIEALTDVQVSSTVGSQGGFQMKFTIGRSSPLSQLHASGFFDPRQRVIIAVTVNGQTEVLMDGIITKQDFTPSSAAGKSMLTVTGLDLTALMDFIDLTGIPYPALPNFLIVDAILAKYAVLGVIPVAIPNAIPTFDNPLDRFVKQQGHGLPLHPVAGPQHRLDLLPGSGPRPGMSPAYWGPDLSKMFGGMQPALSINLDASTSIDALKLLL